MFIDAPRIFYWMRSGKVTGELASDPITGGLCPKKSGLDSCSWRDLFAVPSSYTKFKAELRPRLPARSTFYFVPCPIVTDFANPHCVGLHSNDDFISRFRSHSYSAPSTHVILLVAGPKAQSYNTCNPKEVSSAFSSILLSPMCAITPIFIS